MRYGFTLLFGLLGLVALRDIQVAFLGAFIGWFIDQSRAAARHSRIRKVFVEPLFALLGAVAKADGRVSQAEIRVAERWMERLRLDPAQRRSAIHRFNEGKQAGFDTDLGIQELKSACFGQRQIAYAVLDVVAETVFSDGPPSEAKMQVLQKLAWALHFSNFELLALLAMKGYAWSGAGFKPPPRAPSSGPDPYTVLGVSRDADARTLKHAYRKLISEHHPDRLGDLPEDLRKRAERRASEINAAWEHIKTERGLV